MGQSAFSLYFTIFLFLGDVLEDHIKRRAAEGVSYSTVCFVGDGNNDYCPTLRLSASDYVFPRLNYALELKFREDNPNNKAKVVPWQSGNDIADFLRSLKSDNGN